MADAANADDDCYAEVFGLRHMALRNALYHRARSGWLDGWNRFYNLVIILGGTTSAAKFIVSGSNADLGLGLAIAFVGALQLVYDFGGRSRTHEFLQRRFYDLMADMDATLVPTSQNCAKWRSQITLAGADAPPTLRALDAIMDNQATAALRGARQPRLKVTWLQRRLRHLWPFISATFPVSEGWEAS
ncbi:hypothetical protein [Shinella sp. M31]|uniref:hypothetical protein n=1 Tax=Shinella sp. M31 TaxID=3368615 RepID=UPI003BA3D7B8